MKERFGSLFDHHNHKNNKTEVGAPRRIPYALDRQPLAKYHEWDRDLLACKAAHFLEDEMENDGLKAVKFKHRGKSDESMNHKKEPALGFAREKPIFDLVGVRVVFNNDEEIDKFVEWCRNKFDVPDNYQLGLEEFRWIKDFRKEDEMNKRTNPHMQPDYKAVHMRVPFVYHLRGQEFCDFLEIQAMTIDHYETNKCNRSAYEASKMKHKHGRVNLDEELNSGN